MIKVHCNVCDMVLERCDSEGTSIIISPWKDKVQVVLYIRPMFIKSDDKKELKLTILQQHQKSIVDTLETGHICNDCLLNALSNPKNQILGK